MSAERFYASDAFPCCCGETHHVSRHPDIAAFTTRLQELPPVIIVHTRHGSWYVPRVYVTFHGLTGDDVPRLAGTYEWEPAPADARGYDWRR